MSAEIYVMVLFIQFIILFIWMTLDCQNKAMLGKYYKTICTNIQGKKENRKSHWIPSIHGNRKSLFIHITIRPLQGVYRDVREFTAMSGSSPRCQGVHRDVREFTAWPRASTIEIKVLKLSIVNTVKCI